ncbi:MULTISPECIES: hypothetical protein [Flammeovirga]|uniref:Uncharacterized protein n=1 Tax=Flammeovirga agarivorans TaxID=2726742 RepID=A0A7X8SRH3_9BACT|nr:MULTISPECIES: hypothetical protein [Flammeovirga]NLR95001.1 hypothetical protein [Flammeovirga agarivorans]
MFFCLIFCFSIPSISIYGQEKAISIDTEWKEITLENQVSLEVLKKTPRAVLKTYAILKLQNLDSINDKKVHLSLDLFYEDTTYHLEKSLILPVNEKILLQKDMNPSINEILVENYSLTVGDTLHFFEKDSL